MDSDHGVKGKCGAEASRRPEAGAPLDLGMLRQKRSPELWRSLEDLAETPEFEDMLHREFPRHASEWPEGVSRRGFLQLASASLALAGLTGCTKQPIEKIVPYVKKPEQIIPGRPLFYATALTHEGYATGVLAESHMGRPTKVEGNPDHPASLGATDIFTQAAVLTLYDPARSQAVTQAGRPSTWEAFVAVFNAALTAQEALGGAGIRLLSGMVTSPTLAAQILEARTRFPNLKWHRWDAAGRHQGRAAAQSAFGRPVEVRYDLAKADVVLAIESDALTQGPGSVRYQRDLAAKRRVRAGQSQEMSRLYCVESLATNTSTIADHRLQIPPAEVEGFVLALAQTLQVVPGAPSVSAKTGAWLQAVAGDLQAAAGRSLVVAGEVLSPAAQVLVHGINQHLGNLGTTVLVTEPVEAEPVDQVASLRELVDDLNAGKVEILLALGVNPVYTAPADLDFATALGKAHLRIHHGLYEDETSGHCHWHVPAAHELESWSDARAFDGTVSLIQPLIEPLFDGHSAHEVLALVAKSPVTAGYDVVRAHWQKQLTGDFEAQWRDALLAGLLPATGLAPIAQPVDAAAVQQAAGTLAAAAKPAGDAVTLCFRPDPTIWDGSLASNVWLQELPKPISKLTWDNAVIVAPATAEKLGLGQQERIELEAGGRKLAAAVWIMPGVAQGTAILHLGYGRTRSGERSDGRGFNAYALRTAATLWTVPGAVIRKTDGDIYPFACTQNHHALRSADTSEPIQASREAMGPRKILRTGSLIEYRKDPTFLQEKHHGGGEAPSMYPPHEYKGHAWGMAIDLGACTGCSSCVVACQAENNIPVVGPEQVRNGREMHWIRIDRYYAGEADDPTLHNQPVPCMQCENAPCEVVCPVAATTHSDEGLNDMSYNRCVGTRYCANNCPYKVRRFNFFRFSERESPLYRMLYNPDVTVRMRGVMEKCTYCVQRIEQAKIDSKVEEKAITPDRLKTACQQACPTQAIAFGDLNDEQWDVTRWKSDPLNYSLLEELNTRPRTTYLAKLRNPNEALGDLATGGKEEHGHS